MSVVDGATIEPRIRINRPVDESAKCKVSRAPGQPKDALIRFYCRATAGTEMRNFVPPFASAMQRFIIAVAGSALALIWIYDTISTSE